MLEHTGFAIGGIPPIGHKNPITTLIDEDLMQYEEIWAVAGTTNAVFKLTPKILTEITKGSIIYYTIIYRYNYQLGSADIYRGHLKLASRHIPLNLTTASE